MATGPTPRNDLDAMLNFSEQVGTRPPEKNLVKRAKDMIFAADKTWPVIAQEAGGLKEAFLPYMVVVGFIPGLIGSLITMTIWGTFSAFLGGTVSAFDPVSSVASTLVHFAFGLLFILIAGKVVSWVAPTFGLRSSWVLATRAIVYGSTPAYAASLLFWIPFLGALIGLVAAIWSLLLTFRGFKALLAKSEPAASVIPSEPSPDTIQKSELTAV